VVGIDEFVLQLKTLQYHVIEVAGTRVKLEYSIPVGRHLGENVMLGFDVPADFPNTPPGGPRLSPRLGHPRGAVHEAPDFGTDWEYWSRPFPNWAQCEKTVRAYMAHIRSLFQQL
jgi:hypothetical protein